MNKVNAIVLTKIISLRFLRYFKGKFKCAKNFVNFLQKWLSDSMQYFSVADRYTLVDILRAILLSLEAMIEDPELQVNGFVLIIDWSNFTFKQASKLTPSMLRLAIEGLQVTIFKLSLFSVCHV